MALESITILINGREVDYQSLESLPLTFKKEVDDVLNVVGAKGLSVDRIANQLVFPASKKNEDIFSQIQRGDILNNPALGLADVTIIVQSQVAYSGQGLVTIITQKGNHPRTYGLQLLSDIFDIFPTINETLPCDLPLGDMDTSIAHIIDSWTNPNARAVLAPVVYGSTGPDHRFPNGFDGGRDVDRPHWAFRVVELRPHVKIWAMLEALFVGILGYSIDSRMFESEYFRALTQLFTVGNAWRRTDNYSIYRFRAEGGAATIQNNTGGPAVFFIRFPTIIFDTAPLPQWLNDNVFLARKSGWYKFSVIVNSPSTDFKVSLLLISYDPATFAVTGESIEEFNVNEVFDSEPIFFNPYNGPTSLQIQIELEDGDSFIVNDCIIKGDLLDIGVTGSVLSLQTCLPCDAGSMKSVLLGIMHLTGLVFKANTTTRQVFFETRFYNRTQRTEQGFPPAKNSWYRAVQKDNNNLFLTDIETGQENITERPISPFGDSLTLGYKSSSDPLVKYYEENLNTHDLGFGDVRFLFRATGKAGKTIRNPYYEEMANIKYDYARLFLAGTELGAILDSVPSFDVEERYILPDPTYEAAPKIAYYHGVVQWGGSTGIPGSFFWKLNADLSTPPDIYMPSLYTRFPDWDTQRFLPNGFHRVNLTYCTLGYDGTVVQEGAPIPTSFVGDPVYGFLRRFYLEYLAMIREGRQVEIEQVTKYDEFEAEDFRNLKTFSKFRENNQILVYKIDNFKPLQSPISKVFGLVIAYPTQEDLDAIEENIDKFIFVRTNKNTID